MPLAAQARATPDSVALVCDERHLTFAQLEAESQRVALDLSARGAGPGSRVALLLPRSIELALRILGVWKTGAAYIVLDVDDYECVRHRA